MRILIIIVIYNYDVNRLTLTKFFSYIKNKLILFGVFLKVILYDNGFKNQKSYVDNDFIYYYANHNNGICEAYNYAFKYALKNNYDYLLLLDQDTIITEDYFRELLSLDILRMSNIVAFVPKIKVNNNIVSPYYQNIVGKRRVITKSKRLICNSNFFAINSGVLVKVSFLKEIDGFNCTFWLDYLDYWLFDKISKMHKYSYLLENILKHDLSIVSDRDKVTTFRYKNIYRAEAMFYFFYRSKKEVFFFLLRSIFRFVKYFVFFYKRKLIMEYFRIIFFSYSKLKRTKLRR